MHKLRAPDRHGENFLFLRWRVISYVSSVWNLLRVTPLAPRILISLPNFLKISAFQLYIKFKQIAVYFTKNKVILDTKLKAVKTTILNLYSFSVHFHMSIKFLPTYALLLWLKSFRIETCRSAYCYVSDCLCNILITIKVRKLVKIW